MSQRPSATAAPVTPANRFDSPPSSSKPSLRSQLTPNIDLQYITKYNQNPAIKKKFKLEEECECDISISKKYVQGYIYADQEAQGYNIDFSEESKSGFFIIRKIMN